MSQNRRAEGERATGAYEVLVGASDGLVCFSRCDFVIGRRQGSRSQENLQRKLPLAQRRAARGSGGGTRGETAPEPLSRMMVELTHC